MQLGRHLPQMLRICHHLSTANAPLGVALHPQASGKIQPVLQVIF
jgi:hypothetical protein